MIAMTSATIDKTEDATEHGSESNIADPRFVSIQYPPNQNDGIQFQVVGEEHIRSVTSNPVLVRALERWIRIRTATGRIPRASMFRATFHDIDHEYVSIQSYLPNGAMRMLELGRSVRRFTGGKILNLTTEALSPKIKDFMHDTWDVRSNGMRPTYTLGFSRVATNSFVTTWQRLALPCEFDDGSIGNIGVSVPHDFKTQFIAEFMDSIPEGLAIWSLSDPLVTCEFTNAAFNSSMGRDANDSIVGSSLFDILSSPVASLVSRALQAAIKTGDPQIVSGVSLSSPFDPTRIYRISIAASETHLVTNFYDVTEGYRRAEAIEVERRRAETLIQALESAGNEIIVYGVDGTDLKVQYASERFIVQTGRAASEIVERKSAEISELLSANFPPINEVMSAILSRRPTRRQVRVVTARDETIIYEVLYVQLPSNDSGGRKRIMAVLKDITQEESARIELEQLSRLDVISRISGQIAHEFNNFLQPITHLTQSVLDKLPREMSNERKTLGIALKSARDAKNIVRELMATSGPVVDSEPEHVMITSKDFVGDVNKTLDSLETMLPQGIEIVRLGQLRQQNVVLPAACTLDDINTILDKLIRNSIDACDGAGRINITLIQATSDKENSHLLTIRDNGRGMDETVLNRVFDPFFSTKPLGEGAGFGLNHVYRIVHRRGGTIRVSSKPNTGTTITIHMPIKRDR
jgi:PAS domain S-box-containing protein